MDLSEYIEGLDAEDEEARRRELAEEKSYEIMELIEGVESDFDNVKRGNIVGSKAPSVFVGRSGYPEVPAGILSPVGVEEGVSNFSTDSEWYQRGLDIDNILQYRTGLLDSQKRVGVDVHDEWDGFVGTQREIAMATEPTDIEFSTEDSISTGVSLDDIASPRGPTASASSAKLTENPYVPRAIEKAVEDDDWNAEGAMEYLYEKGLDVYQISQVLSAGTLGEGENRRLVPTRWSITAVDDAIGKKLRNEITVKPSIDRTRVYRNEFMGNRYWIILTPGKWEFELVEMKDAGSVWNPEANSVYLSSAYEGFEGRTQYVEETAGAYYAARLGVLEFLQRIGKQAKCLVLREVTDEYWAPVGVWQVRESVRNGFGGEFGEVESLHTAVSILSDSELPVSESRLQGKSQLVGGIQKSLVEF